ncbi:MAG: 50S ribosomal protein L23 [Puniceicoccales bacterium]|jgi:large subunit ribosomal protein L23|nr:50S ribosomal protein L23 [Puniceicoccales bacterium]MDR1232787.1 50S ribosomal protein L23 [Puniceicoccales bacterium]MDR2628723.1 50S ribosomal protein L23 [Puniceicoccales bacterium]
MENFGILKEILLTEKSNALLSDKQQYVFVVDQKTNKGQIARAVEKAFNVKVVRVNVINCCGRPKRVRSKSSRRYTLVGKKKKAIVVLKDGYKIDVA